MRNLSAVFVLSLATLAGCGLLKKPDADAGSDAAVVDNSATADAGTTTAAGTPVGKNAAQVATFPSQTAQNQPRVIGQTASPHTAPNGGGSLVTTLKAGTPVTLIATNGPNQNLIVFADPNVPTDNLEGWVTDAAFSAAVIAIHHDAGVIDAGVVAPVATVVAPAITCGVGQVGISVSGKLACKKACNKEADCPHKGCKDFTAAGTTNSIVKACLND